MAPAASAKTRTGRADANENLTSPPISGATLGSDPERRRRASGAEAERQRSASSPGTSSPFTGPMRKTQPFWRDLSTWTYAQPWPAQDLTRILVNVARYNHLTRFSTGPRPQQMDIFPEQLADIIAEQ